MKKTWIVLALVLAVSTAAYGTAVASANHGHGAKVTHSNKGHGTVHGTVASVDTTANTITLTSFRKCDSITVNVTSSTKIKRGHQAATLADIQAGDRAVVKLAKDGSAKAIHAHAARLRHTVHGTISAVDTTANTVSLTEKKTCQSVTVPVTSDTKIRLDHKKATLADLAAGDRALVKVGKDGNARRIIARSPKS